MRRVYFFVILALQLIAYPIAVFDLGEYNDQIYYGIIVSCFLTSAVFLQRNVRSYLQLGALYFTCIADFCLILGRTDNVTGVCFFFVVQLFYAARTLLSADGKRELLLNICIRTALCAILTIAVWMVFGEETQPLFIASVLYYANLLVNIAFSFLHFKGNELLCIGLVLFALCDTVLGLKELGGILALPKDGPFYQVFHPPFALEAAFYCPSQMLLSVSAYKLHKKSV